MEAKRLIHSYGRRRGRKLRASRQVLMEELLPKIAVRLDEKIKISGPLWLEIGFGGGEHLAAQALQHPTIGMIGCEPYIDGVASLLAHLHKDNINNVRIFTDDARLLIEKLPAASVDRVFILFPDPWPKARHHKRRLIQQPFLELLARVMKPGAELRLATDHADYCTWMLEQMLSSPHFTWTAREKADWENPPADWIRTRYQEWAEGEGRRTTYLIFQRNP
jgi:tRNA (guanine-N7-)-methyltransferase